MKHFFACGLFLVVTTLPLTNTLPLSKSNSVFITPGNIRYLASFLHSTTTTNNHIIHIGAGERSESEIIRVPLAGPGEVGLYTSIRITVGLRPPGQEDKDPRIGISDGVNSNMFYIPDNLNLPPCYLLSGDHDNNLLRGQNTVQTRTPQFVLLFEPFHQYGACSSAQEHGYINTGTFSQQLDTSKGLHLLVKRGDSAETYDFNYFIVEFLN